MITWIDFLLGVVLLAFIPAFLVFMAFMSVAVYGWWGLLLPIAFVGLTITSLWIASDNWRERYN